MSDFLGENSVPLAAAVGFLGIVLAYVLQMNRRRYEAPYYWFMVMMVAVFGTMVADGIHDGTGISYVVTTPLFAATVAVIFLVWYRLEGTLSIHRSRPGDGSGSTGRRCSRRSPWGPRRAI